MRRIRQKEATIQNEYKKDTEGRDDMESYLTHLLVTEKPEPLVVDYGYWATQTPEMCAIHNNMVYERTMMTRDFKKAKELNNERERLQNEQKDHR
jgi:hypothetical protein